MAKTNAERQREYRARRPQAGENGERRVSTWVSTSVALRLDRLARHYGVTKRQVLERLILAADEAATANMGDEALDAYLGKP